MRRPLLVTTTALALLLTSGSVSAQETSSEPAPSTASSPLPASGQATEPLPVADYWGKWAEHKIASRGRVELALNNVKNDRKKRARFYREAVVVHRDELAWLAHHQPDVCYADEYEQWRAVVDDLHSVENKALTLAKAGNDRGLRRTAKQRRAAVKRLNRPMANVAGCGPPQQDADDGMPPGEPFVGRWKSADNFVQPDGFHNSSRLTLTIGGDGGYLLRDSNAGGCRANGYGYVPATLAGNWLSVSDDPEVFAVNTRRAYCYPRDGRPRQRMSWEGRGEMRYDEAYDVVYEDQWGYCWHRKKGGSPRDCTAFWKGTPPKTEDAVALAELDTEPDGEAADPPEGSEG